MWVTFGHLRPSGHIMPDHAGDRGAVLLALAPHDPPSSCQVNSAHAPAPNGGLPGRERGRARHGRARVKPGWASAWANPDIAGLPFGTVGWSAATIVVRSVEGVAAVTEGRLPTGLPYLRLGQGPPLVMALGGAAEHANPGGAGRRVSLATAARFAGHFTVYVTSCKPGLAPGTALAGIAADYAAAIGRSSAGRLRSTAPPRAGPSGCSWRSLSPPGAAAGAGRSCLPPVVIGPPPAGRGRAPGHGG